MNGRVRISWDKLYTVTMPNRLVWDWIIVLFCFYKFLSCQHILPEQNIQNEESCNALVDDGCLGDRNFNEIDNHALHASSTEEESIDTFAEYLSKLAKNDVEKVRAIYRWVWENIRYDFDALYGKKEAYYKAEDVLKNKNCICNGYANIFRALCEAANIKNKKLYGYSRGASHMPGKIISYNDAVNHTWNAVYVEGKWQFVEPTWCAGFENEDGVFEKRFSSFYFLTKPEYFIVDHFPYMDDDIEASKTWQLLNSPISIEEFSKSIKPTEHAHKWGIKFVSHQHEVIIFNQTCDITIETSIVRLVNVMYEFSRDDDTLYNNSVAIVSVDKSKFRIMVKPRKIGNYTLKIYGTTNPDKNKSLEQLVQYSMRCTEVSSTILYFPNNTEFYGPKKDDIKYQFADLDKINTFVSTKAGYLNITLETIKQIDVMGTLETADQEFKRHIALERQPNQLLIRMILPVRGYFKFTLWSKSNYSEKYTAAMDILLEVLTEDPEDTGYLFPEFGGFYGPANDIERGFVDKISIPTSFATETGFLNFTVRVDKPIDVMATLTKDNRTFERHVVLEIQPQLISVRVILPERGFYILSIWSSRSDDFYTDDIHILLNALTNVNTDQSNLFPKFTGFFGPTIDVVKSGFINPNKIPASTVADTGNLKLTFEVSTDYKFTSSLILTDETLERHVALEKRVNTLAIRLILPYKGFYHLMIWSTNQSNNYTVAVNILLESLNDQTVEKNSLFPDFDGCYGPNQDIVERGFDDPNLIQPFVTTGNGTIVFLVPV